LSVIRRSLSALILAGLVVPSSAAADGTSGGTGGAAMPEDPKVAAAVCEDASAWQCARGARLTLEGESLDGVRQVRFVGGRGTHDDRTVRPQRADEHRLDVQVPRGARSGRIAVVARGGGRTTTARRLVVRAASRTPAEPATPPSAPARSGPAEGGGVFPIAGPHTYGTETNAFGGGRSHGGQDVFARCGTPLVALYDVTVQHVATQDRAGNYVVLQRSDGESYAYMHMQAPADVSKGDTIPAGTPVGRVGDTGRASGCHLHFEQWTAPGWYEGGKAVDPLPLLRALDG
jgi:murein DD-endopeptidase MepM/ murein hydrolase activator NlpD